MSGLSTLVSCSRLSKSVSAATSAKKLSALSVSVLQNSKQETPDMTCMPSSLYGNTDKRGSHIRSTAHPPAATGCINSLPQSHTSTPSMSVAAKRSTLAKAVMLLSHFAAAVNQLATTCNLISDMKRKELEQCLADIKCDFLNLITIQKKIYQICSYARSLKEHYYPEKDYERLVKNRLLTLHSIQEEELTTKGWGTLYSYEQEINRYRVLLEAESPISGSGTRNNFYFSEQQPGKSPGGKTLNKYELIERIANYKVLLHRATLDHQHLIEEVVAINCLFFGLNNKQHLPAEYRSVHVVCEARATGRTSRSADDTSMSRSANNASTRQRSRITAPSPTYSLQSTLPSSSRTSTQRGKNRASLKESQDRRWQTGCVRRQSTCHAAMRPHRNQTALNSDGDHVTQRSPATKHFYMSSHRSDSLSDHHTKIFYGDADNNMI